MSRSSPKVVVLAGPNGAGKSTSAARLLRGAFKVDEFVNADTIAAGLSAFVPEKVAFEAGRIMMRRLAELADACANFGFETTLASRSFAPWLAELRSAGYEVHIVFLWLPSPDEAVARVAARVRTGGHSVPDGTIRRRYNAGLQNLFSLYLPLADSWQLVDNGRKRPRIIAVGTSDGEVQVTEPLTWQAIIDRVQGT